MVVRLAKRVLGIPYVRDIVGDEKQTCFFIREGSIDYCLKVIQNECSVNYQLYERFRKRPFWDKNECGYTIEALSGFAAVLECQGVDEPIDTFEEHEYLQEKLARFRVLIK